MLGRSRGRFAPRHWLVIVLVVLTAIFEAHPDGEPPDNHWLRLLLDVYARLLYVDAPVTLLVSNLLTPAQRTIGSRAEQAVSGRMLGRKNR